MVGEVLTKPCPVIMVGTVLGDETKREVSKISLFNNTVRRRIPTCATKFARRSVPVNF